MDIQKIKKRLEELKERFKGDDPILFQHTMPTEIAEEKALSKIINQKNILYMRLPKGEKTYMGCGITIKHEINSKEEFLDLKNKIYKINSNIENPGFNMFGATSFDLETPTKTPWKEQPKAYYYNPEILFTYSKEVSTLTYTKLLNRKFSVKNILNQIKEYRNYFENEIKKEKKNKKTVFSNQQLIPEKSDYIKSIEKIVKKINKGELEKIVISRIEKYSVKNKIPLDDVILKLNNKYPNCCNFLIEQNDGSFFLSSSPEKLIEINEQSFNTLALAGTSKHKNSLNREKEINEHSYVVEYLKETLDKFGDNIYVERNKKALKLDYAYHIQTPISGKLKEKNHILDILETLYPTPALAGYPIKDSIEMIHSIEKFDRGLYGGAVGFYNEKGTGCFFVSIRSALIKNHTIFFYSGSGIVAKSIPEKEWDETDLKLEHLKTILK